MNLSEIRPKGTELNKKIDFEALIKEISLTIKNNEKNIVDLKKQLNEIKDNNLLQGSFKMLSILLVKEEKYLTLIKTVKEKLIKEKIDSSSGKVIEYLKKMERDISEM
jgi:hypothetical protein